MKNVDVRYSHAAPYIREAFVRAHEQAVNAVTKRDRQAQFAAAYAYSHALQVMAEAADTEVAPGIVDLSRINMGGAVMAAYEWLGGSNGVGDRVLGTPDTWDAEAGR